MHYNRQERNNQCDDHICSFNTAQSFIWPTSQSDLVKVEFFQEINEKAIKDDLNDC